MKVCERLRESNFKYYLTVRDISPGGRELDSFFDVLPDILHDYAGETNAMYITPAQIKIEFKNKSDAMDMYKNISREYFEVKFYNIV